MADDLVDLTDTDAEELRDPMPGGDDFYYDDLDAEIIETMVMIGLAGLLAFLVYYRRQRELNRQRNLRNQEANGHGAGQAGDGAGAAPREDRGFFPEPGAPDFGQWIVGH